MEHQIKGGTAFSYLHFYLAPGEHIAAESDAMASMSGDLTHSLKFNGGFLKGVIRKFLGGESLFINYFYNDTNETQELVITQPVPGEIRTRELSGDGMYLQPGSYVCNTDGVKMAVKYAGLRSFIAREGLFRLYVHGTGTVWFGAYGRIMAKKIDGEYIVDTAHIVGYDPGLAMRMQLSGGLISSFFSGEGLVSRMEGKGRIYLQSRSLNGLAQWLNPYLP